MYSAINFPLSNENGKRDDVAMTLPEPTEAFELRLQAIFADEARAHLAQVDASLAALGQAAVAEQPALLARLEEALHTLKSAARSIGLGELEYLCHALEVVIAAAAGAPIAPTHIARIRPAVDIAGLLLAPPEGRIRNQAMALVKQLEALARELAAPPPSFLPAT